MRGKKNGVQIAVTTTSDWKPRQTAVSASLPWFSMYTTNEVMEIKLFLQDDNDEDEEDNM